MKISKSDIGKWFLVFESFTRKRHLINDVKYPGVVKTECGRVFSHSEIESIEDEVDIIFRCDFCHART